MVGIILNVFCNQTKLMQIQIFQLSPVKANEWGRGAKSSGKYNHSSICLPPPPPKAQNKQLHFKSNI